MLRAQMFFVIAFLDAIAMIGVGIGPFFGSAIRTSVNRRQAWSRIAEDAARLLVM